MRRRANAGAGTGVGRMVCGVQLLVHGIGERTFPRPAEAEPGIRRPDPLSLPFPRHPGTMDRAARPPMGPGVLHIGMYRHLAQLDLRLLGRIPQRYWVLV